MSIFSLVEYYCSRVILMENERCFEESASPVPIVSNRIGEGMNLGIKIPLMKTPLRCLSTFFCSLLW